MEARLVRLQRRQVEHSPVPPALGDRGIHALGGQAVGAVRGVEVAELIRLAAAPTTGFPLGESARATFAIIELAHRSLREGLVHPSLVHEDGSWSAFWGATLDGHVQAALSAIAAAMPPACAGAFDGDAQATVLDLYPVVVDQLARDRLP